MGLTTNVHSLFGVGNGRSHAWVHAWCCAPAGRESGQVVVAQCDRRSVRESGTYKQFVRVPVHFIVGEQLVVECCPHYSVLPRMLYSRRRPQPTTTLKQMK